MLLGLERERRGWDKGLNIGASLVAQMVKNVPAMQETRVRSLDQEDALEKEMATHSSIPAWRIPWAEEPGGLQSIGLHGEGQVGGQARHPQASGS